MAFGVKSSGGRGGMGRYASTFGPPKLSKEQELGKENWKKVQSARQKEYQSAYQDILSEYKKYQSREDDEASILKSYYLELLQDMIDARKSRLVVQRWAKGEIVGLRPQQSAISSRLPREYG